MSYQFLSATGGRSECFRFYEEMMLCVKKEGVHRNIYKCDNERQDFHECINNEKKVTFAVTFLGKAGNKYRSSYSTVL